MRRQHAQLFMTPCLKMGWYASLPWIAGFFAQPLAGWFSDWLVNRGVSVTASRKSVVVLLPYLAELLTPGAVGRSLGVVMLGSFVGSAVAQPLIAKLIIQTPTGTQYWPVFMLFAVCGLLTSSCVAGMIEPRVGRTYWGIYFRGGNRWLALRARVPELRQFVSSVRTPE